MSAETYSLTMRLGDEGASLFSRVAKVLRVIKRGFWLGAWIVRTSLEFAFLVGFASKKPNAARRAWFQQSARRALGLLGLRVRVEGRPPRQGLLVSNHLSYLDILVIASVAPAVFVAKREVRAWPVFGWLAQCAGTIFVNREKRRDVVRVGSQIEDALACGAVVVLFPEGTSSNGHAVLPFRSPLLAPVLRHPHRVSIAALDYEMADGSVEEEVCYWGDSSFGPHLLNLLSKNGVDACVKFREPVRHSTPDRKQLAVALRESVCALRSGSREDL